MSYEFLKAKLSFLQLLSAHFGGEVNIMNNFKCVKLYSLPIDS